MSFHLETCPTEDVKLSAFREATRELCGCVHCKPSRGFTRPLGVTLGFKRLVARAKCNRGPDETEEFLLVFVFASRTIQVLKVGEGVF